jgi:hypothetical protein
MEMGFGTWDVMVLSRAVSRTVGRELAKSTGWKLHLAEVQEVECIKNGIKPPDAYTFLYGKVRVWDLMFCIVRNGIKSAV